MSPWLRDRNPLRCAGTPLPANVLLAAKLIVLSAFALGYVGKVAIHPAQVAVINDVFTPSAEDVAHHRRIIEEFDKALEAGSASIAVDGKMVDYAVARVAREVIARAELAERAAQRSS